MLAGRPRAHSVPPEGRTKRRAAPDGRPSRMWLNEVRITDIRGITSCELQDLGRINR